MNGGASNLPEKGYHLLTPSGWRRESSRLNKIHRYIYYGVEPSVLKGSKKHHQDQSASKIDLNLNLTKKKSKFVRRTSKDNLTDFQYKKDNEILLKLPTPPFFFYIPAAQEMQLLIKK